jgi:2-methylisocitrate lyase-like PEP mutase family enzyme
MIFIAGHEKLEHIRAVHAATQLPILCTEKDAAVDREVYAACGARILIQGHQVIPAAVKALRDTYTHLFNGGAPSDLKSRIASAQEMEQLVSGENYKLRLCEYMR